jgi:hypothetical protein
MILCAPALQAAGERIGAFMLPQHWDGTQEYTRERTPAMAAPMAETVKQSPAGRAAGARLPQSQTQLDPSIQRSVRGWHCVRPSVSGWRSSPRCRKPVGNVSVRGWATVFVAGLVVGEGPFVRGWRCYQASGACLLPGSAGPKSFHQHSGLDCEPSRGGGRVPAAPASRRKPSAVPPTQPIRRPLGVRKAKVLFAQYHESRAPSRSET